MTSPTQRIKRLQTNLKRDGFDPGVIDGRSGPATSKAFTAFQLDAATKPDGIDVSRWNPDLDFDELAHGGDPIEFIYVKATDGTGRDKLFERNWSEASRVKLPRGAYHWLHPSKNLEAQADAIFNAVGVLQPGDLPVAIDVERDDVGADGKIGTADDVKATDQLVEKFANLVANRTGRRPLIYSYNSYLDEREIEVPSCLFWVADYREGPPNIAPGWSRYTFHQYRVGTRRGAKGLIDMNRFNGSKEELRALAGL